MTLTLYGGPRSRASMVRWYLEEKGLAYDLVAIDLAAGEQHQPAFHAINPFGKVPALVDSSVTVGEGQPLALFESGAILLHLARHHAKESDHPAWDSLSAQWVLFANATLGPAMFAATSRPEELGRQLAVLDPLVARSQSLLSPLKQGPSWGAADCAVQAYLAYLPMFCKDFDLSPYPGIQESIAATTARSAYRAAMGLA